jgi:hypothetical protein
VEVGGVLRTDEKAPRPWLIPLQSAARAAIVVWVVFAVTDLVVQNPQTTLVANLDISAVIRPYRRVEAPSSDMRPAPSVRAR